MRKNVKKQLALRVLSTAALVAMVSSIATAAFADTYDLNTGSVTVETKEDGFTYVTQLDNTQKDGYARNDKDDILHDYQDKTGVTITSNGNPTENTITVETAKDQTTDVTLDNVDIEQPDSYWSSVSAPIEIKGNGNTNLELNGDNTVLSGNRNHAGIEKADVNGTGTLTIKDDVNDNGKPKTGTDEDTTGKLLAGGYDTRAGIGGGGTPDTACTSNITITGGDITARGSRNDGAGIGGGAEGTGTNIRIEGNAHVTATGDGGAAIGGGVQCGNDVTIAGNAVVNAYSEYGAGIGDGSSILLDRNSTTSITITDNAKVHAEAKNGGAAIGSGQAGSWNQDITIEKNATVTAVGSISGVAIGTCHAAGTTSIQITGGTVNAINSYVEDGNHKPAIGGFVSKGGNGSIDITINSNTGDTVVNAYTSAGKYPPAIGVVKGGAGVNEYILSDGADYNEDGSSKLGETHSAIINYYKDASVTKKKLDLPDTLDSGAEIHDFWDDHCEIADGTLTKVVHNRKYMEEHPEIVDITKLKDEDLHDWQLVGKVVEPTPNKDGYADYICSIDKCGQTKHVVLPKTVWVTPSTPDTPDTPDTPSTPDVPSTPEVTPADPAVTPDAPAQDGTAPADTPAADTTADTAAVPADAQKVTPNAKPETVAAAPAAAAALPQTGANWLAVVGTALSGLFLLAAGFVLDRKNRRMN